MTPMQHDTPPEIHNDPHDLVSLAANAHDALVKKQARAQELQQRPGTHWLRLAATSLTIVAAGLLGWYALSAAPGPTDEQLDKGRIAALRLISISLADHLRAHGRYPELLEEALPLSSTLDVGYRRTAAGYELDLRGRNGILLTVRHG